MKSQLLRIKKIESSSDKKVHGVFCRENCSCKNNGIMDHKDFKKAYRKFKRKMKWKDD